MMMTMMTIDVVLEGAESLVSPYTSVYLLLRVVSPTPEAYTSKTCCRCLGSCGPWEQKEAEMGKKIRGLRRCTQRDCMLPLNRDRNGATNIGTSGCCKERCRFAP